MHHPWLPDLPTTTAVTIPWASPHPRPPTPPAYPLAAGTTGPAETRPTPAAAPIQLQPGDPPGIRLGKDPGRAVRPLRETVRILPGKRSRWSRCTTNWCRCQCTWRWRTFGMSLITLELRWSSPRLAGRNNFKSSSVMNGFIKFSKAPKYRWKSGHGTRLNWSLKVWEGLQAWVWIQGVFPNCCPTLHNMSRCHFLLDHQVVVIPINIPQWIHNAWVRCVGQPQTSWCFRIKKLINFCIMVNSERHLFSK